MKKAPAVPSSFQNKFISNYSRLAFVLFLISLWLLSTQTLSLEIQLFVGFFGLVLPLILGVVLALQNRSAEPHGFLKDTSPIHFGWFWALGLLLLFLRFYRLDSIPFWPLSDESVFSTLAYHLTQKWNGALLCSEGQIEPLLFWLLSFFFKAAAPSVFSLRVFTVLISLGAVLAAYAAARFFLSRTLSLAFAGLFSFSFWAIQLSRQCTPNDLIPFFELTAFFLLGLYWKFPQQRWKWVVLLGLWTGLGFYTFINWTVVWAVVVMALCAIDLKKERNKVLVFLALSLSFLAPLALARLQAGSSGYLQHCLENFSLPRSIFQYTQGLFWDGRASFPLGPSVGGYLDPLTGALVFTGALYALRHLSSKLISLFGAALVLCLLPGLLTNSLELQRITPVLPLLIFLAVLGTRDLLDALTFGKTAALMFLLLVTALLNTYQLAGPYNDIQRDPPEKHWRSLDYFTAHHILKHWADSHGPLYLFNEWNGDYFDKTLDLACFSFNAAQNPLAPNPQWMAFLTDADYAPLLQKRFAHLQVFIVNPSVDPGDKVHLLRLFIVPLSDLTPGTLELWKSADADERQVALSILNRNPLTHWSLFAPAYAALAQKYGQDPFLASVLWEKAASFLLIDHQYQDAAFCFNHALQGYAAPHLRHNLKLAVSLDHP
jgi:4-amino-4-deoxy-L-arabinose transferase-like glycosyltransferase